MKPGRDRIAPRRAGHFVFFYTTDRYAFKVFVCLWCSRVDDCCVDHLSLPARGPRSYSMILLFFFHVSNGGSLQYR